MFNEEQLEAIRELLETIRIKNRLTDVKFTSVAYTTERNLPVTQPIPEDIMEGCVADIIKALEEKMAHLHSVIVIGPNYDRQ